MSQNSELIPKRRFKEFDNTGDWEQRKFIDLVNRLNTTSSSLELPKVEFEDIVAGKGILKHDVSQKFDNRKGVLFEPNNILYGKLRPYLKNWLFANFEGIALGDFWVFEANNSNALFDYYLIQSERFQLVANDTSGTKMPRSDWKLVSNTDFPIPKIKEQSKIGSFFKVLDDTITLHQRKLDKLKNLKQSYLYQMFPQNGQMVPKLRFAGFSGDWERRKLKDLGVIQTGNTPSTRTLENYDINGMLWVTPTDIDSLITKNTRKRLSEKGIKKARIAKAGSILVTSIASIGKNTLITMDAGFNQQINSLTPFPQNNSYFLLSQSILWSKQMNKNASSGTMQIVNKNEFSNIETLVPILSEQKLIGQFFQQLDETIEIQQQELQKLKNLKEAYLNEMFV